MNIAVTGASGFVGRRVVDTFTNEGHVVRAVSLRTPPKPEDLNGSDAVIHLAGEPVAQRWTPKSRERIRSSRIEGTRWMVETLARLAQRPAVLVSASAIGYYGSHGNDPLTESSPPSDDFLGGVAAAWEREAQAAESLGIRVVRLRFGIVLGRNGGALKPMLVPFRLGVGGRIGDGKHWMSWIHLDDAAGLIAHAIAKASVNGAMNATAPNPVTNSEFTQTLARQLHRPALFPVPRFALRLLYGEMAQIVYASQRVMPEAAIRSGFAFRFPELGAALRDLLP